MELDHRSLLSHNYALINPLQVDKSTWEDLPVEVLLPAAFTAQPHLMPVLLSLDALDMDTRLGLLERIVDWKAEEDTPWLSALLASPCEPERIKIHLTKMLSYRQPGGSHDLFRFFDPRVFQHLDWLLTSKQVDTLMGPIKSWSWPSPQGHWHTRHQADQPLLTLLLTQDQQHALSQLGELNILLQRLQRKAPEQEWRGTVKTQQVYQLLQQAQHDYGMTSRPDRYLFVEQALLIHLDIHRNPEIQRCLAAHRQGQSYVSACKSLDYPSLRKLLSQQNETRRKETS